MSQCAELDRRRDDPAKAPWIGILVRYGRRAVSALSRNRPSRWTPDPRAATARRRAAGRECAWSLASTTRDSRPDRCADPADGAKESGVRSHANSARAYPAHYAGDRQPASAPGGRRRHTVCSHNSSLHATWRGTQRLLSRGSMTMGAPPTVPPRSLAVDDYHKMGEAGILRVYP